MENSSIIFNSQLSIFNFPKASNNEIYLRGTKGEA